MNDSLGAILIPKQPEEYDARALDDALFTITSQLERMTARGRVMAANINVRDLPTSATGLSTGDVWWDTGTNTLQVAP